MFSKKSIIFFASTLTLVSLASARIEYNESTSVASDISDSWIVVDYPKSGEILLSGLKTMFRQPPTI